MKLADKLFERTDWRFNSAFGMRKHPITGVQAMHNGADYGTGNQKWPQYALEDGTVSRTGYDSASGNFLYVQYPRIGIELFQCHMDKLNVKSGDEVTKGSLLGITGTTGSSTGIHLHLGLRKIGTTAWIDPHVYDYKEEIAPVLQPLKSVNPYPMPSVSLRKGNKGQNVNWVQWWLTEKGYGALLGAGGIDGIFGVCTDTAVRKFQKDAGIEIDGIVGPVTRGKLEERL